jgi:hypothetical protein
MAPKHFLPLAVVVAALVAGCQARQLARDSKNLREAVLDIYTDQAMDNLVRARCGLPFAQLTYRDVYYQDDDSYSGTISQDQTLDNKMAAAASAVRDFVRKTSFGASAKRDKLMSLHADIITNQNDIYEMYFAFAGDPSLLAVTDELPDCGVHIYRKHGGKYYWVPSEAGPVFQQLVMRTTFMRGADTLPAPYYAVKIVRFEKDWMAEDGDEGPIRYVVLYFDQPVPNGNALMMATLSDGRKVRLDLFEVSREKPAAAPKGKDAKDAAEGGKAVQPGQMISYLRASWNPVKKQFTPDNLVGASAQIYSHDYPPQAPATDPALQRINDNLNAIRANTTGNQTGKTKK